MKTFQECCNEIGYDRRTKFPDPVYKYFSYEGGNAIEIDKIAFENGKILRKNAEKVEKVETHESKKIREEYRKEISDKVATATELWEVALREEYGYMQNDLFSLCYAEAYERGHSCGMDEVASYMSSVVYFANRVLETK